MAVDLESNSNASVLVQIYPVPGMIHPAPLTQFPMTLPPPPTPLPMNYYPYPYSYALGIMPESTQCSTTPPVMTQTILSPTLMPMPVNVPLQMPVQMTIPQIDKPITVKPVPQFELPNEPTKNCEVNRKKHKVKKHSSEDELNENYDLDEDGEFNSFRSSGGIVIDTSRSTTSLISEVSCEKPVAHNTLEFDKWQKMQTIAYITRNHVGNCEPEPVHSTYDPPKFVDILANTVWPTNSFEYDKPSAFKDIYLNISLPDKLKKRRKTKVQQKKSSDDLAIMLGNLFKLNTKLHLTTLSSPEGPEQRSKNTRKKPCSPIRIELLSKSRILKTDGNQIKPVHFPKTKSVKTWQGSDSLGLQANKSDLNSTNPRLLSKDGKNLPQQRSTDVRSIKMIYKRNECNKDQPINKHSEIKVCGVKQCSRCSQLLSTANKSDRSRSNSGTCYPKSETENSLEDLLRSYPLDAECCAYNDLKKIMQHTNMTTGKKELNRCISDKLLNTPHKFSQIFRNYTLEMMPSILYMSTTTKKYKPKSNLLADKAANSIIRPQHYILKEEPSTSTKYSHETYLNSCYYACKKLNECSAAKCCVPPKSSQASLNKCEDVSNPCCYVKASNQQKANPSKINSTCDCPTTAAAANDPLFCLNQKTLKAGKSSCIKAKIVSHGRKCCIKRNTSRQQIVNSDPLQLKNTKCGTKPLCYSVKTKICCQGGKSCYIKKKTQKLIANSDVIMPSSSSIKTFNKNSNSLDHNDVSEDSQNYTKKSRKKWPPLIPFGQTPSAKRLQHLSSLKNYRLFPFWKRCYNLFCNPYCCCSCACGCSFSCHPRLCQPNCDDCNCNYCYCYSGN